MAKSIASEAAAENAAVTGAAGQNASAASEKATDKPKKSGVKYVVMNRTLHLIYLDGVGLLPGTNVVERQLSVDRPAVKRMIEKGLLEISEPDKASETEKKQFVEHANSAGTLSALEKMFKVDTRKRKGELDDFDREITSYKDENKSENNKPESFKKVGV